MERPDVNLHVARARKGQMMTRPRMKTRGVFTPLPPRVACSESFVSISVIATLAGTADDATGINGQSNDSNGRGQRVVE
jgi:hypothetical protein